MFLIKNNLKRIVIMETSEKCQRVLALISAKADCEVEEIKMEQKWMDIGLDSLDVAELIMEIEKEFAFTIPDADMHNLETIGDAIAYVEKH